MMNKPTQLIYPTVDLFLYDLRDSFGQSLHEFNQHRQQFWQKIDPSLDNDQLSQLAALENPEADYVQLLVKAFESPIDGYYRVLQLGDIYALQVNCSGDYKDAETKQPNDATQRIETLSKLKKIIASHINNQFNTWELLPTKQGTIGQTWLVSVQIADSNQDPKQLAKDCYEQLTPNPKWIPEFREQGRLLGARVFEYWHSPDNWQQDWTSFSQENYHLIICMFPAGKKVTEIRQNMYDIHLDLIRLFSYRHKIIWAYWQSRCRTQELKLQSYEIRSLVASVRTLPNPIPAQGLNLKELQSTLIQTLPTLSDYAMNLNDLEYYMTTIQGNLENYQKRIQKLERETSSYLKFLNHFSEVANEKYLQQVATDGATFRPGLPLMENLIRTIGSVSGIEQTKSNRTLNTTVALIGIGLIVSSIAATVLVEQLPPAKDTPFFFTTVFWGSISTGVITVVIAFILLFRDRS
ncbi:DUF308 domain-containing protein [Coleofasciculus sp. G2-EDA-02]|uniref:DUF308 domain-containing protein n=1 Tax=Coleofasciculus sp. G2-EDA-02 TaxID=3069529 RepID=UPI0033039FAA